LYLDNGEVNSNPPLQPLQAGGSPANTPAGQPLTQEALDSVASAAVDRWEAVDPGVTATLEGVRFEVAHLDSGLLGLATQGVGGQPALVQIDDDAGGTGWFIDATPSDDMEFSQIVTSTEVRASAGDPAFGKIDLLTAVMHELGHVVGLAHPSSN